MEENKKPKSLSLLLLLLLAVSAGLLLLKVVGERIESGGLSALRDQQASQEKLYEQIP